MEFHACCMSYLLPMPTCPSVRTQPSAAFLSHHRGGGVSAATPGFASEHVLVSSDQTPLLEILLQALLPAYRLQP